MGLLVTTTYIFYFYNEFTYLKKMFEYKFMMEDIDSLSNKLLFDNYK